MALTYRTGSGGKGSALTIEELDNNFRHFTGSHSITGSLDISGSLNVSGSVTADYFIGDGSQLTNLPIYTGSSSVTGSLEVKYVVSDSKGPGIAGTSTLVINAVNETPVPTFAINQVSYEGDTLVSGQLTAADLELEMAHLGSKREPPGGRRNGCAPAKLRPGGDRPGRGPQQRPPGAQRAPRRPPARALRTQVLETPRGGQTR